MRASGIARSSFSTMRRARALFASLDSRGMLSTYRMDVLDLRSDTVTRPTEGMRRAMAEAEVGDDVYVEDPTINALEERVADLFGHEAALFVPSGTMGNQIGMRLVCEPGQEVLCDADAHVVTYEMGAAAAIFGISTRTVVSAGGRLDASALIAQVRPKDDWHL